MALKSMSFMPNMAAGKVSTSNPAGTVAPAPAGANGKAGPDAPNANVGLPDLVASSADLLKMEKQ